MNAAPLPSLLPEPVLSPATVDTLHEFASFVNRHLSEGRNVFGTEQKYLSRAKQRRYWTPAKIRAVQRPLLVADPETIQREYLGVYSMLAYSNKIHLLKLYFLSPALRDELFPLYRQPGEEKWPAGEIAEGLFTTVQRYQNVFFPLVLNRHHLDDRRIEPDRVLPITKMELLRKGNVGEASVYKIRVDPEYNELFDKASDVTVPDTYALKVQPSRSFHNNEVTAFAHFKKGNYPSAHIINCYGSFIQSEKYCLILEYVDGGNLERYLRETHPPTTPQDRLRFWKSLIGYLKGIHGVHQVTHPSEDGQLKGLHGDLKPDNMLLKMDPSGSPYDFIAKVADFGYSHFRRVESDGQDNRGLDRHGNQQYCAPEASHHTKFLERGPNRIDSAADIFSLGAIFSEVSVWMAFGPQGIEQYFRMRKEATDHLEHFKGSGYGGCFHNAVSPLAETSAMHERVRANLAKDDHITPKMIDLVEQGMLCENPRERWPAVKLLNQFDIYYQAAKETMLPRPPPSSSPISPRTEQDIASPINPQPSTIRPILNGHSHARSLSAETLESIPSVFTESVPGSPFQTLEQQVSTITLDGVFDHSGGTVCLPQCEPRESFTQPNRAAPPSLSLDIPPDAATNEPLSQSSTTPQPHRSTETLQHLTVHGRHAQNGSHSPSSIHGRPILTLQNLKDYREFRKGRLDVPVQLNDAVQKLQKYIKERDHIFYIDDSDSMRQHKTACVEAFTPTAWVAKQVDKDGIEIVFGSEPTQIIKSTRTTALRKRLQCQRFDEPFERMAHNFDQFVRGILVPRLNGARKELSVLIFTDGVWGDDIEGAAGVEGPVEHLMQNIVQRDLPPTRVMLSFVQFGNDVAGQRRLKYLDDCGKKKMFYSRFNVKKTCDNVDTGPINGNVCKLFIGSLIPGNDEDDADVRQSGSFARPP